MALSCVGLALWMYRRALDNYFSPDDLVLLEWARALAPGPATLWRFLSGRAYFGAAVTIFGTSPFPYFVVNWLLHGLNVALTYILVRSLGGSIAAATLSAGLFGSSRLFLTVIGQAVGLGDLLSLCLTLIACIAVTHSSRRAYATSALAFALAMLAKETVVLLPLVLLMAPGVAPSFTQRLRRLAPLIFTGVIWIAYLALAGVRNTVLGGSAYATGFGTNIPDALLMFGQWSVDLHGVAPDYLAERSGHTWIGGLWVLAAVLMTGVLLVRRSRLPLMGASWWLAGLLPVLPLIHQKHLHYLYAPSVGFALWISSTVEALLGLLPKPSKSVPPNLSSYAALGAVGVMIVLHASVSDALLRKRFSERLVDVDLPNDTFLRKMEFIRRVSTNVGSAIDGRTASIAFFNPLIRGSDDFYTHLLPAVLDDGRGLRALYPNVDSVVFLRRWTADYARFDIFAANEDGRVIPFGHGPEANLRLVRTLAGNGYETAAADLLLASVEAYPSDLALRAAYAGYMNRAR